MYLNCKVYFKICESRRFIRLLGVRFDHLIRGTYQINLFDVTQGNIKLYQAIDSIKKQFGESMVRRSTDSRFKR